MKRRIAAWAISLIFAAASGVRAETPLRIGVFDPQRVSEETEEGKKVQADLTTLRDKKQAELSAKEKDLTDMQNRLTEQGLSLSPERRATLEKDIQRKILELNQAREAARNEMQFELGAAQSRFQDKLLAVVERFGRDEGFSLILDKTTVAYATAGIDVTTAIVDRFNEAMKQATGKPETAPAPPPAKDGGH